MNTSTKGESLTQLKDDLELDAYNERLKRKEFWVDKAKLLAASIASCAMLFGMFSVLVWAESKIDWVSACTCTIPGSP